VTLRFISGPGSDVYVPRSAINVSIKSVSQVLAVALMRLPGQDWPDYQVVLENVKSREGNDELGFSSGED
jgi:hypothetical protein